VPVRAAVRRLVLQRAGERCEYCQIRDWPLTVDHVVPMAIWRRLRRAGRSVPADPDEPANLAAACGPCNQAKGSATTARDPLTGVEVPLFDPRRHAWAEHFAWVEDATHLVGVTAVGRATVARLRLNGPVYVRQRRLLRTAMRGGGAPWP
jgi:hypothetical protein